MTCRVQGRAIKSGAANHGQSQTLVLASSCSIRLQRGLHLVSARRMRECGGLPQPCLFLASNRPSIPAHQPSPLGHINDLICIRLRTHTPQAIPFAPPFPFSPIHISHVHFPALPCRRVAQTPTLRSVCPLSDFMTSPISGSCSTPLKPSANLKPAGHGLLSIYIWSIRNLWSTWNLKTNSPVPRSSSLPWLSSSRDRWSLVLSFSIILFLLKTAP